jgi:hypothetical protein
MTRFRVLPVYQYCVARFRMPSYAHHTNGSHRSWDDEACDDLPAHRTRPLSPAELRHARCKLAYDMLVLMGEDTLEHDVPPGFADALQEGLMVLAHLQRVAGTMEEPTV